MKKLFALLLCAHALSSAEPSNPFSGILPGGCYQPNNTESATYTPSPIVAAVEKAAEFNDTPANEIAPANEIQKAFLQNYLTDKDVLNALTNKELRSWADTNIDNLNKILKKEGFDIRLAPMTPGDFGVVSILKVEVEWKEKAQKTHVTNNCQLYEAILLEARNGCSIAQPQGYAHPIARVNTASGDKVCFTIADAALEGFALRDKIETLRNAQMSYSEFSSVKVPMIDLDQTQQLDWLLDMVIGNGRIAQALQQTKFKMNEVGAKVESAVAIGVERCSAPREPKEYVIDQDFYVWIEREGMDEPYFSAYVTPKDWQHPGELG